MGWLSHVFRFSHPSAFYLWLLHSVGLCHTVSMPYISPFECSYNHNYVGAPQSGARIIKILLEFLNESTTFSGFKFLYDAVALFLDSLNFSGLICIYVAVAVLEDCLTFSGFNFLYFAVALLTDSLTLRFVSLYVAEAFCQDSFIFSGFKFLYFLL